jgi:transcriptional regulator with XRE-family HTH domain
MNGKKNSKKGAKALDEQQEFIEKICNKIRKLREESGFSQENFAYEHGIDRRQWYNMENGVDMRLSTLQRAIAALSTTPAEFFNDFK